MLRKSLLFFSFFAVAALIIGFVLVNSDSVDVNFIPENYSVFGYQIPFSGTKFENINLGFVILSSVVVGFLIAWIVAAYLLLIGLIKRKKVEYDVRRKEKFIASMLEAREAFASKDWQAAKSLWHKVQKQDPSQVLANVEISRVLEGENKTNEALKTIDAARAAAPKNVEVLFRAVDLYLANSNKTAALDNLALILSNSPNQKAAILARDLSEQVGKLQDAIEYNEKALELGNLEDYETVAARIKFKQLLINLDFSTSDAKVQSKKRLKKFIKSHKKSEEAYHKLAELEAEDGDIEKAAELLFKASNINGNGQLWHEAVQLWIDNDAYDRALATAKTAAKNTSGLDRVSAELDIIKVHLALGTIEDAKKLLDQFPEVAEDAQVKLTKDLKKDYLFLRGLCLNRLGKNKEAAELWIKLSNSDLNIDRILEAANQQETKQPPPKLSTP